MGASQQSGRAHVAGVRENSSHLAHIETVLLQLAHACQQARARFPAR